MSELKYQDEFEAAFASTFCCYTFKGGGYYYPETAACHRGFVAAMDLNESRFLKIVRLAREVRGREKFSVMSGHGFSYEEAEQLPLMVSMGKIIAIAEGESDE